MTEITTSACTQTGIPHTGASVLLREAGCHSACAEYIYICPGPQNTPQEGGEGGGGGIEWEGKH